MKKLILFTILTNFIFTLHSHNDSVKKQLSVDSVGVIDSVQSTKLKFDLKPEANDSFHLEFKPKQIIDI